MKEKLISVIIPVYNTAEYLPRCLDSILKNTYQNLEVICINDGSPDNSMEILEAYAARDSRIRVINQKNAGVSAARNRGLDEASGQYITFIDSDDWIDAVFFEMLLNAAVSDNAHITACQMPHVSVDTVAPSVAYDGPRIRKLTPVETVQNNLSAAGRLYRADIIGTSRFTPDIRLAEDTMFNLNILNKLEDPHVLLCDYPLYFYFMRDTSAIHSLSPRELEPLINWYISHLDKTKNKELHNYYLIEALKNLFTWRYSVMFLPKAGEKERIQKLIDLCKSELRSSRSIGIHIRLFYGTMLQLPIAYRLFRILNDPTMLGWERQQKKARAERNK